MILDNFAKERKYDINILKDNGWYEEDNVIKLKIDDNYILTRTDKGWLYPKDKPKKPYFISGNSDKCVIVEGQTDAIAIKHIEPSLNVFAIGGVMSYKKLDYIDLFFTGKKIILCFDNDDAGVKCTEDTIDYILHSSKLKSYEIRVLSFNDQIKDIDEFYRQHGSNEKLLKLTQINFKNKRMRLSDDIFIELKKITGKDVKIGQKIKCINPEHDDKTASMHVYEDSAYCFGCGFRINPKKKINKQDLGNIDNLTIKLDNYIPNVELFHKKQPFFYDKVGLFWFWDNYEFKYEIKDDTDVMIILDKILGLHGQTVNSKEKANYLEAMKRVGRINIPKDAPKKWLQFKDKAYSLTSGSIYEVKPNYFFTNPIPFEIGDTSETPVMDKLFTEWVGENYKDDLYQLLAYCCYSDYPIQLIFCLYGYGRNGKSQYIKLLNKFIGRENICSTELDKLIDNRFESFKLYKKLVCSMGETNFGVLKKTSLLKSLVGGDLIGYEKKNKGLFDDINYAKIIIASNSLPNSDDDSDGFMRRWHIIDFPNEFPEGKDIINTIPKYEYSNLAKKVTEILPKLLEDGRFKNLGSIETRRTNFIMASNPIPLFIAEYCEVGEDYFVSSAELYSEYISYLKKSKTRKVKKKEFKDALDDEGFYIEKTTKVVGTDSNGYNTTKNTYWVEGLKLIKKTNKTKSKNSHFISLCGEKDEKSGTLSFLSSNIDDQYYLIQKKEENSVIPRQALVNTGVSDEIIDKCIEKGDYFEPRPGFIQKVV
jgi:putative DNA primase/helicase